MESTSLDSTCIYCRESIKPGARRCPHCQSWQSRWAADSANPRLELTLVAVGLVVLAGLVLVWALGGLDRSAAEAQADPAIDLMVTEASVVPGEPGAGARLAVVGTIVNQGEIGWRSPYLQVELYDETGALVDNFSARAGALFIPAHSESTFKVVDRVNLREPSQYARCEVSVRWADRVR